MPDRRKHRGQHPSDQELFSASQLPAIRQAVEDLSCLLGRGYGERAALKLVGDRYRLKARQRKAVLRSACPAELIHSRRARELKPDRLTNQCLHIDGFNLLITIESALSGGLIFEGLDGCYRDLASVHGTYKRVSETETAVRLAGKVLEDLKVKQTTWLFDKPVSNSGRLKVMLNEMATENNWIWEVELDYNPDNQLSNSPAVVVSSDSQILNAAPRWCNFAKYIIDRYVANPNIIVMEYK